ncbi:hypothetical protein NMY22_g9499 [Coprinellus aureogranulatus]|nr:hypothetical protein NMY22_g9499 [Coprinellus aureogranulatus]
MLRNQAQLQAPFGNANSDAGGDRYGYSSHGREAPAAGQVELRTLLPAIRSPDPCKPLRRNASKPSKPEKSPLDQPIHLRENGHAVVSEGNSECNSLLDGCLERQASHKGQPAQARGDHGFSQVFPNANRFGVNTMYITINNHHWLPLH